MSRNAMRNEDDPKVGDLLIRQKCEAMIEYGQSVQSWIAHASHADSLGLRMSIFGKFAFIKNKSEVVACSAS